MKNDFFRKNRKKSENPLDKRAGMWYNIKVIGRYTVSPGYAGMAELADALDSGSSEGNFMQVQFLLPAPKRETAYHADERFLCYMGHLDISYLALMYPIFLSYFAQNRSASCVDKEIKITAEDEEIGLCLRMIKKYKKAHRADEREEMTI